MTTMPPELMQRLNAIEADKTRNMWEKASAIQEELIKAGTPWAEMTIVVNGSHYRLMKGKKQRTAQTSLTRVNSDDNVPW